MASLHIDTYGDALLFGVITGLGYLTANTVNIAINFNFPRPLFYAAVSGTYNTLGSVMVGVVLLAL